MIRSIEVGDDDFLVITTEDGARYGWVKISGTDDVLEEAFVSTQFNRFVDSLVATGALDSRHVRVYPLEKKS